MANQMTEREIREAIAESGKTKVSDVVTYFKAHYAGRYNDKVLRENAKEIIKDMRF